VSKLTAERARQLFHYDPHSGELRWRESRGRVRAGRLVGSIDGLGYRAFNLEGKRYSAHRVAWLIVHGAWPSSLDHANGVRSDNRLDNLREATQAQNLANRPTKLGKSGHRGVYYCPRNKKWIARIWVHGRAISLGYFKTAAEAAAAYAAAAVIHHGEFAYSARKEAA